MIWDRLNELRASTSKGERLPSLKGVSKKRIEGEMRMVEEVSIIIGQKTLRKPITLYMLVQWW